MPLRVSGELPAEVAATLSKQEIDVMQFARLTAGKRVITVVTLAIADLVAAVQPAAA